MKMVIDISEGKLKSLQRLDKDNRGVSMLEKAVLEGKVFAEERRNVLDRVLETVDKCAKEQEMWDSDVRVLKERIQELKGEDRE